MNMVFKGADNPKARGPQRVKAELVSANIKTYLLARNRVVQVAPNERNYHCFYMMFHLPDDLQEHLGIKGLKPKQFKYLGDLGQDFKIAGQTDAELLQDLIVAFEKIGISKEEVRGIWEVLAGILPLGTLVFDEG